MNKRLIIVPFLAICLAAVAQPSGRVAWNDGWIFTKDGESRVLNLPHDWGVEGPFRQEYPGETGKLAWWGDASYSKSLEVSEKQLSGTVSLEVDGAFSNASVFVNGQKAGEWPYGYSSWSVNLTAFLKTGSNSIEVRLNNKPESSRWYPGGGIYRNVWLRFSAKTAVSHWGSYVTTLPGGGKAIVRQSITLHTDKPLQGCVKTQIIYRGQLSDGLTEQLVAESAVIE